MSFNECSSIHTYWDSFNKYAQDNALIYREIFGCIPDNTAVVMRDVA